MMTFDSEARNVTVFLDLANFNESVRNKNVRVDYREFRKYLSNKFNARIVNAYTSSSVNGELSKFHHMLELSGYRLKTCRPKIDEYGNMHEKGVDTSLVIDMVKCVYKDMTNHIILVSGDKDMLPAVEAVQSEGCLVTLLTYTEDECDRDLGRICDNHILLSEEGDDALGVIQFDPTLVRSSDNTIESESIEEII